MAKTKKQKIKDDALEWLKLQGIKAYKNKNKKEVDTIAYILTELLKPDYEQYLENIRKIVVLTGTLSVTQYMTIVPPNKTKLINQKANK